MINQAGKYKTKDEATNTSIAANNGLGPCS